MENYDDFDTRVGVEEVYRSYALASCDKCKERVPFERMHTMESFKYPDKTILLCTRCYGKLMTRT